MPAKLAVGHPLTAGPVEDTAGAEPVIVKQRTGQESEPVSVGAALTVARHADAPRLALVARRAAARARCSSAWPSPMPSPSAAAR